MQRGHNELAAAMHGNLGAVVASGRAMVSGLQHGLDYGRRLAGCGSAREVLKLQAAYAQDSLRACVDELAGLGELTGRLMNDCWTPLMHRAEAAAGTAGRRAS